MKITIDIAAPLLRDVRQLAARNGTTLRALVERGLRRVLEDGNRSRTLRKVTFKGRGLRPELRDASREQLRVLAYESCGG